MVQFGGRAVRAVPLTTNENIICLSIGAFSLVWGVIIKAVLSPDYFNKLALSEEPMTEEEEKVSTVATFRKSYRQSTMNLSQKSATTKDFAKRSGTMRVTPTGDKL